MDFCTVGSCECMCTCQHGAATGHPLCIYFWPAAGSSSLTGVCLCECVSEVTSVGIHVFTQDFVFSAVATYLFSQSLRMFCSTLTRISLSSGLDILEFLTQESVISESNTQPCTLMKHDTCGSGLSLLR